MLGRRWLPEVFEDVQRGRGYGRAWLLDGEETRGGAETQMVEISGNKGGSRTEREGYEEGFFEDDDGETRKVGSTWWSSGPVVAMVPSSDGGGVDARCNRCSQRGEKEPLCFSACAIFEGCYFFQRLRTRMWSTYRFSASLYP